MRVALDIDDFTIVSPRLQVWLRLKEHFPDFKVSMFTIPSLRKVDYGPWLIREETAKEIRKHLDWIQIIPHGWAHESSREFRDYDQATFKHDYVPKMADAFAQAGLPWVKGFKAPHWQWSQGVVNALNELGWWGAVLREDKMIVPDRYYRYNYLLNEPFPLDAQLLKLHGHVYGTKNDIGTCMDNLLRLPRDTQFDFITDHLQ